MKLEINLIQNIISNSIQIQLARKDVRYKHSEFLKVLWPYVIAAELMFNMYNLPLSLSLSFAFLN